MKTQESADRDQRLRPPRPHTSLSPTLTCKYALAYCGSVSNGSEVFQALAAPARRAILDELQERNGQTLFELCARLTMKHGLEMSRQAISQHLDVLEAAGLVTTRREGRYKFHYLDTGPLRAVLERWTVRGRKEPPA
jgi:DNA-binding transcriptional ArsR family regulator